MVYRIVGNFCEHKFSPTNTPGKKFIFATRSRYPTTPPTISRMEMVTLSMYFNIKMTVRCWHAYQSVSVTVGEELPYQREGANSKDLFAVAVMTTSYRRLRKISAVCSMHSTRVLYYPCQQPSLIARPRSAFRFHSRVRRAWEQGYQQPLIVVNGG